MNIDDVFCLSVDVHPVMWLMMTVRGVPPVTAATVQLPLTGISTYTSVAQKLLQRVANLCASCVVARKVALSVLTTRC